MIFLIFIWELIYNILYMKEGLKCCFDLNTILNTKSSAYRM